MELLLDMQSIAQQKGGKCLSKQYINSKEKLLWECNKGHMWEATPFSIIVRKSWCPVCAGNQPLGMDAMHKLAKINEGKCLSNIYKNCKTKMLWQCQFGHKFETTADNVKQGKWCPQCNKSRV
jgi:hypothetical protein